MDTKQKPLYSYLVTVSTKPQEFTVAAHNVFEAQYLAEKRYTSVVMPCTVLKTHVKKVSKII